MNFRTAVLAVGWAVVVSVAAGAELRLGIIGCDTSHVVAFTETLNNPNAKGHLPGARVVAAFKGGSKDIPASWSRVEQFSLIESLYTVLGADCQTVQRGVTSEGKLEVVGTWSGGRKGIFREDKKFHQVIKGEQGEISIASFDGYAPLLAEIVKFFQTGVVPVKPEETLEILAFMEAADESKRNGGKPVTIGEIFRKNRS